MLRGAGLIWATAVAPGPAAPAGIRGMNYVGSRTIPTAQFYRAVLAHGWEASAMSVTVKSPHLYLRRTDSRRALRRYFRELHVCPAIKPKGGVHLAVTIDLDGPPPGAEGHERQIAAGLNLTPKQARKVIRQMQAILDDAI